MKLIHALLPACALLLPCALRADAFEGKVTMSISSSSANKSGPQTFNYSIKGSMMRMDMPGVKAMGGMIMDLKNQQMIILMTQQKMYMVQPIPQGRPTGAPAGAAQAEHAPLSTAVVNTGEKETILGYSCSKLVLTTDRATTQMWVTDQLGMFGGLFHGGGFGGRGGAQPPAEWESVLKGAGFFPMRVISTKKDGSETKLEVTAVEKESLPDSLFAPPDGWRKFDIGAMMGGYPGGRPSDSGN